MNRGRLLACVAPLVVTACVRAPYSPPADIPLQDPLPGQAIAYFVRIPYDVVSVTVKIDGKRVATMSPSTYTAVSLSPGHHTISTELSREGEGAREIAPPEVIDAKPDERTFWYLTGLTDQTRGETKLFALGKTLFIVGPPSQRKIIGGWRWKETSEMDAQGLMSIAKLTLPDRTHD